MIALILAILAALRASGLDARLYEDGSVGIVAAAWHIGACVFPAWGCA